MPYALSVMHNLHRIYPEFLIEKGTLKTKDIRTILESINPDEKVIFNQKYIQALYDNYQDVNIIEGSNVLADHGYDSWQLINYIYENDEEPTIPSKKGAKFERHCDWWLYKERHLVEKYFLKLKGFRRIATVMTSWHLPAWDLCVWLQF